MSKTVVFVHGANVTSRCWERFRPRFEAAGYTCIAPDWPGLTGEPADLRATHPASLAGLGVEEIVDHYAAIVRDLPEPPCWWGTPSAACSCSCSSHRDSAEPRSRWIRRRPPASCRQSVRDASHFLLLEPGWEAVADKALAFFEDALAQEA